jgi:DNA-binding MarR family transcriptional regulator
MSFVPDPEPAAAESREVAVHTLAGEIRAIAGKLRRRLRELGSVGDLTASQIAVLFRLERDGPATVTGLARAEGIRSQSMGATVAALEANDLVTGDPDPDDGRQTIWRLTPTCLERIAAARAAREDWLYRTIQAELSPTEQDRLAAGVALLSRLLDQ